MNGAFATVAHLAFKVNVGNAAYCQKSAIFQRSNMFSIADIQVMGMINFIWNKLF